MITTLTEANNSMNKSEKFYYDYIKDMQSKHGNINLCRLLGKSDKYIFKILERKNTLALKKLANEISEKVS